MNKLAFTQEQMNDENNTLKDIVSQMGDDKAYVGQSLLSEFELGDSVAFSGIDKSFISYTEEQSAQNKQAGNPNTQDSLSKLFSFIEDKPFETSFAEQFQLFQDDEELAQNQYLNLSVFDKREENKEEDTDTKPVSNKNKRIFEDEKPQNPVPNENKMILEDTKPQKPVSLTEIQSNYTRSDLFGILFKFCAGVPFEEKDFKIGKEFSEIFHAFINAKVKIERVARKLIKAFEKYDIEGFNSIMEPGIISKKRNDENRKYIYKNVTKLLKTNFRKAHNLKKDKESDRLFWEYHFQSFARQAGFEVDFVFDPINQTFNKNTMFKNLTKQYFAVLFKNEEFRQTFFKAIETLKDEYNGYLKGKIDLFLGNFDGSWESQKKLIKILKERGTKLPWSLSELQKAISFFKSDKKWENLDFQNIINGN